jgi:hypothetical protein
MPKVRVQKEHGLTRQEAVECIHALLADVQRDYGQYIDRFDWNGSGDGGTGKGTGFKIRFSIDDVAIDVTIDISFVFSPLKSKVTRKINEKLTDAFAKTE